MSPDTLEFLAVARPGEATMLTWLPPSGDVAGYVVYATKNPFPPRMAPELFAGRMAAYVRETPLGPDVHELRLEATEPFYAVVAKRADGAVAVAADLREVSSTAPRRLEAAMGVQCRTYLRARWIPRPHRGRAAEVAVYIMDDAPEDEDLGAMLSGSAAPDYRLDPLGDGFIDTATPRDFRKFYAAVLVSADGSRRPLRLLVGGFQRLEAPVYLSEEGPALQRALMEAVTLQIASELRAREVDEGEIRAMLDRALDLSPDHDEVRRLAALAAKRFG